MPTLLEEGLLSKQTNKQTKLRKQVYTSSMVLERSSGASSLKKRKSSPLVKKRQISYMSEGWEIGIQVYIFNGSRS